MCVVMDTPAPKAESGKQSHYKRQKEYGDQKAGKKNFSSHFCMDGDFGPKKNFVTIWYRKAKNVGKEQRAKESRTKVDLL